MLIRISNFIYFLSFFLILNPTLAFCQNDDDEPVIGLPTDWSDDVYDYQTLPKIVKKKISCMASIQVSISTSGDSHNCNAAQFSLYANEQKLRDIKEDVDIINLNNGSKPAFDKNNNIVLTARELNPNQSDLGGSRKTIINIDQNLAREVIKLVSDTTVRLYLECITPQNEDRGWGFGGCHEGVPFVEIVRIENGKETIIYQDVPKITMNDSKVELTSFDPCFNIK